jgi:RimJ/RimL family protein N-acetyltransferase
MALDVTGIDLTTEVIRTERLVLRPFRPDDEDAVLQGCHDPEIPRWISVIPSPYTRADARRYVSELPPGNGRPAAPCR